jgi:NitT/TauT family transport system substrate-binding protein
MLQRLTRRTLAAALCAAALAAGAAHAETRTVKLAKQFGISYLPLTVMEQKGFLEDEGKKVGLDLKTEWIQFSAGNAMNEAILSGNLDFASGGVGPLLTIWSRTRGNIQVKAVAALNAMPLFLTTVNPNVRTIADFTEKDRIALPAVRTSIQAVTLQMAAEQVFGPGQHAKLDQWTVSLGHPDAQVAMMGGQSGISAHFTSAPFMYDELADKRVHKVLDSYDVLGGPHTFNVVWAQGKLAEEEPKLVRAFVAALDRSIKLIKADPADAAATWTKAEKSKMSAAEAEAMIRLPENEWTMTPKKIMAYADFMSRTGIIPARPDTWKDLFFDDIHAMPGS